MQAQSVHKQNHAVWLGNKDLSSRAKDKLRGLKNQISQPS